MRRPDRLLIGSCLGLTGHYLSKIFMRTDNIVLIGIDRSGANGVLDCFEHVEQAPDASSEEQFIQCLINLINDKGIDFYLPTHSTETLIVARHRQEIEARTDIKLILSPYQTYKELDNKAEANACLSKIGVHVPRLIDPTGEISFPVIAKPPVGSGSKGTLLIEDRTDLEYVLAKSPSSIFLEYLDGKEFTVDAIFDSEGVLVSYNQRERIKTLGGAVVVTKNNFEDYDCIEDLKTISTHHKFCGVVNFQFILKDDKAHFIDVNLRYASGGLALSVASGLDLATILLKLLRNEKFDRSAYQSDRMPRTMHRVFDEIFVLQ